jgi:hypothetical protein
MAWSVQKIAWQVKILGAANAFHMRISCCVKMCHGKSFWHEQLAGWSVYKKGLELRDDS